MRPNYLARGYQGLHVKQENQKELNYISEGVTQIKMQLNTLNILMFLPELIWLTHL